MSKARLRGSFWAFLDLIPNAVIGLLLLLGAVATSQHELTLGGLVAFITLTLLLVWPIEAMGYILASGQEAATAAQRIYEILDTESAITDSPVHAAPAPPPRPGQSRRPAAAGSRRALARLVFDRVEFGYPGTRRPVLRGVCLELEPGQTLGADRCHRRGQDHPAPAGAPAGRPGWRAASCWTAPTSAPAAGERCARGSAARSRTRRCSRPVSGRT